ncbi:CPBP family intramembrane glutamic endopeptidase [Rhodanobacter sp. DHG33]|uniref:CPBP family intramembrane glutamic endopeptidase n=1 Tax=Rhodanobacter sp. DHG33 TaxID=2775921 RepID=UPI0017836BA9|nr:CPBP family intramembrane glutamic endopeptidase [Rhodanobacter sp. DHG33]MBD8898138.1 CPBP family intramembrane metalloprotease [Rhodanobacter sp. DHG33]
MDAPRHSLPPGLPPTYAASPSPHAPGIAQALGMIVLYFALQVAFGILVSLLLGFVYGIAHPGAATNDVQLAMVDANAKCVLVVLVLVGAAAVTLWLAHRLWPRLWPQAQPPGFGFAVPSSAAWCAIAVAVGLMMPLVGGKLTELLAHGHAVPQDVKELGGDAGFLFRGALTLAVISIGPAVEELLFRGALLSALLRRLRVGWAIWASAALFALVHLPDLHWLWYALPNLALLGAALAWLRLRSGSLWPAVIAHGCNNLLAMAALFASLHHPV